MRAVWWLLKLAARTSTRVRAMIQPTADVAEAARANLKDFIEKNPELGPSLHELAAAYQRTFCGRCGAGPQKPAPRCSACVELLERVTGELHNDERARLAELVKGGRL